MNLIEVQYGALPYGCRPAVLLLAHHDHDGDKKVKAIATGFLAVVQPFLVLITAAHAFKDWSFGKMFVKGPKGDIPLPVGKIERSEEEDVAVLFFETDALSDVIDNIVCIQPEEISNVADSGSAALFQMHGFPSSKSKYSHVTKWSQELMAVSLGCERELPVRSQFFESKVSPLCFDLDLKDMYTDTGERTNSLGRLEGMSGSPVVRHKVEAEGLSSGLLVGMFVEWCHISKTAVVVPWGNIERFVRLAASK